jgi:hypothetical protein
MTLNDSYLFDAGWLFFALWTVIVGAVSITAFRRDLIPSRAKLEPVDSPTTVRHSPPEPAGRRNPVPNASAATPAMATKNTLKNHSSRSLPLLARIWFTPPNA